MKRQRSSTTESSSTSSTKKRTRAGKTDRKALIAHLFRGKLDAWLPLFHRLLARLSHLDAIEIVPRSAGFSLMRTELPKQAIGTISVRADGVRVGLCLPKAPIRSPRLELSKSAAKASRVTHVVLVTQASHIDGELLNWIKAAHHQARARTSKRRST